MNYIEVFLKSVNEIASSLDKAEIQKTIDVLVDIKNTGGRLFLIGVGGSAANASHAVNDFRKIANIETYAPTDNVSELTARTNDEGWESTFSAYLETSRISNNDAVLVLSVGGGDLENNISVNIINAIKTAKSKNAKVIGVVGYKGGYTGKEADACIKIPYVSNDMITPLTESFQSVVLHLIVSHPLLKQNKMKWESVVEND